MRELLSSILVCALAGATGCDVDQREPSGSAPGACEGNACAGSAGTDPAGPPGTGAAIGAGGTLAGAGGSAPAPDLGGSGAPGAGGSATASGSGGASGVGGAGDSMAPAPGVEDPSPCATELLQNGSFESGVAPWAEFFPGPDPVISSEELSAEQGTTAKTGEFLAWFGGVPDETTRVSQTVTVPEGTLALVVSGYRRFISRETQPANFVDRMTLRFVRGLDIVRELEEWGNQDASPDAEWELFSQRIDAAEYIGQQLTLQLESSMGSAPDSNFFFDDLSLIAECTP
jgi:hypothetical protein